MKIQIDTEKKLIKIEETANLGQFFSILEELLPDLKWREYDLEAVETIINWTNPIPYIPYYPDHPENPYYISSGVNNISTS